MNAVPIFRKMIPRKVFEELRAVGAPEEHLVGILDTVRPNGIDSFTLMERLGIEFTLNRNNGSVQPHSALVTFENIRARAGQVLSRHGWQIWRAGAHPSYDISIVEQEVSS